MSDPYADGGGPAEPRRESAFSPDLHEWAARVEAEHPLPSRRSRREDAPSEPEPEFGGERPTEANDDGDGQEAREDEYRATHADEPYDRAFAEGWRAPYSPVSGRAPDAAEFAEFAETTMAQEPVEQRLARAFANGWREGFERGQWADRLDR